MYTKRKVTQALMSLLKCEEYSDRKKSDIPEH